MTTTSHKLFSSSLAGKASVLSLSLMMVASVLFAAAPSAMAQQTTNNNNSSNNTTINARRAATAKPAPKYDSCHKPKLRTGTETGRWTCLYAKMVKSCLGGS